MNREAPYYRGLRREDEYYKSECEEIELMREGMNGHDRQTSTPTRESGATGSPESIIGGGKIMYDMHGMYGTYGMHGTYDMHGTYGTYEGNINIKYPPDLGEKQPQLEDYVPELTKYSYREYCMMAMHLAAYDTQELHIFIHPHTITPHIHQCRGGDKYLMDDGDRDGAGDGLGILNNSQTYIPPHPHSANSYPQHQTMKSNSSNTNTNTNINANINTPPSLKLNNINQISKGFSRSIKHSEQREKGKSEKGCSRRGKYSGYNLEQKLQFLELALRVKSFRYAARELGYPWSTVRYIYIY